jgi:hypothetical protein
MVIVASVRRSPYGYMPTVTVEDETGYIKTHRGRVRTRPDQAQEEADRMARELGK